VEPKTGALVSRVKGLETPGFNHRFAVSGGVRAEAARELIQEFFRVKRRL
jgi:tRNA(Arg) A34 adenosine deaminase TadA